MLICCKLINDALLRQLIYPFIEQFSQFLRNVLWEKYMLYWKFARYVNKFIVITNLQHQVVIYAILYTLVITRCSTVTHCVTFYLHTFLKLYNYIIYIII